MLQATTCGLVAASAAITARYCPDRTRRSVPHCFAWNSRSKTIVSQVRCDAVTEKKEFGPEPTILELRRELQQLPVDQMRAALSLLGLAIGDSAGLPFELRRGAWNRAEFRRAANEKERYDTVERLVRGRCASSKGGKFTRSYSDDTTCCDLKMEAVCQAHRSACDDVDKAIQMNLLQQYLKWAHVEKSDSTCSHGSLFQGTGGFTRDFLTPHRNNEVARIVGKMDSMYRIHPVYGDFWPTEKFATFATEYFQGKFCFASWGNGAVMSFAPHPVLAGRWRKSPTKSALSSALEGGAGILSKSHQEPTALLASQLMWDLLDAVYSGVVETPQDLRRTFRCLPRTLELLHLDHECIPVSALQEWLENGDCKVETATSFLRKLTGEKGDFNLEAGPNGVFGSLLRIASDWNDDHRTFLKRRGSKEPVLFSQRGINSLIIGVWAASEAHSPWDFVSRVIWVGGDTDTVGAVAGQIACPLLDPAEVVDLFTQLTAMGANPATLELKAANAAARRYFARGILFARGDFDGLRKRPSLLDADYPTVTC